MVACQNGAALVVGVQRLAGAMAARVAERDALRSDGPACAPSPDSGPLATEPRPVGRHRMGERATRREPIQPALDRSLVDRARTGDLDAFEEIVRARMDAVYRLSFAILGNEADARDAAQDTFVAAWKQIGRVQDVGPLRGVAAARGGQRGPHGPSITAAARGPRDRVGGRGRARGRGRGARGGRRPRPRCRARRLPVEQRAILVLHHLEGRPSRTWRASWTSRSGP